MAHSNAASCVNKGNKTDQLRKEIQAGQEAWNILCVLFPPHMKVSDLIDFVIREKNTGTTRAFMAWLRLREAHYRGETSESGWIERASRILESQAAESRGT